MRNCLGATPIVAGRMGPGLQLTVPAVAAARGAFDAELPTELRKLLHLHGDLPYSTRGFNPVWEGPVDGTALFGWVGTGRRGGDPVWKVGDIYKRQKK